MNGAELAVIAVLALLLIGPERLPHYAEQLARLVKTFKRLTVDTSQRMRDEFGPEFAELDLQSLDPRQYDPRRIVRDALRDEPAPRAGTSRGAASRTATGAAAGAGAAAVGAGSRAQAGRGGFGRGTASRSAVPGSAPFDDEAT